MYHEKKCEYELSSLSLSRLHGSGKLVKSINETR